MSSAELTFFCGKMGAGKSTRAAWIAAQRGAVLISEDDWLAALYPDEISTFDDYLVRAARLRSVLEPHLVALLRAGTDVVLDFPGNTAKQRAWFLRVANAANAEHALHYLATPDDTCLAQIAQRRVEKPERAAFDTEEMFRKLSPLFELPREDEGLNVVVVTPGG